MRTSRAAKEDAMTRMERRSVVLGLAAAGLGRGSLRAAEAVDSFRRIDLDKAKAEGKVVLYTSLDTQIVDAIIAAFKQKYGVSVEYFRGGSADVTSASWAHLQSGRCGLRLLATTAASRGALRRRCGPKSAITPASMRRASR